MRLQLLKGLGLLAGAFAIGGIYLFDETFWGRMDAAVAANGENFSISDVKQLYLAESKATLRQIGDEIWLDCGTPDALLEAAKHAKSGRLSPLPCNLKDGDYLPPSDK